MILEKMLEDLGGTPTFRFFTFNDVNPVSGRKKFRTVAAPNEAMKTLQRRFAAYLRSAMGNQKWRVRSELLRYATSSNPGDSPFKNVYRHRKNRFFYLLDFSDAYRSVRPDELAGILRQHLLAGGGLTKQDVERFLRDHFFRPRQGLIPGGPASQDLFNLYVGALVDSELGGLVEREGLTYTRYLDDLTFSSPTPITPQVRQAIREPVLKAGFRINHRKCECVDLKKRTVIITGIGIADGGRLFVPRPYLSKVRGLIHRARTKGGVEKGRITGMMSAVRQVLRYQEPNRLEQKVLREYDKLLGHA